MLKNPVTPMSHQSQYMGLPFFIWSYSSFRNRSVAGPQNEQFQDTQELKGRSDDAKQWSLVEIPIFKLSLSLQPVVESHDEFK